MKILGWNFPKYVAAAVSNGNVKKLQNAGMGCNSAKIIERGGQSGVFRPSPRFAAKIILGGKLNKTGEIRGAALCAAKEFWNSCVGVTLGDLAANPTDLAS